MAAGDISGAGKADIITGAGPGGLAQVTVFSGANLSVLQSFWAFANFGGGVFVSAGDVNGDGKADIIVGAGPGGGPQVSIFNGVTGAAITSFFDPRFSTVPGVSTASISLGVRVGTTTVNGQTEILAAPGSGSPALVDVFSGRSLALLDEFFALDPAFLGGAFVGG